MLAFFSSLNTAANHYKRYMYELNEHMLLLVILYRKLCANHLSGIPQHKYSAFHGKNVTAGMHFCNMQTCSRMH